MPSDKMRVFALEGSRDFGESVAAALGSPLSAHEERDFEDGEHKARPLTAVRDADVYVIHSLYGSPEQSANDKLCRLLFFIATLKDAGAARVTAITPYLCYARKDRRTKARDPVTTRYVAGLFESVGTDALVTVDVHNLAAFQNAFRCRTEHLEASGLMIDALLPELGDRAVTIVSPDVGGSKRAEAFRERLQSRLAAPVDKALLDKQRSEGKVSGSIFVGDVEGRVAIIVDDLISTGTTLVRAGEACRAQGASAVYAVATHGLFMEGAEALMQTAAIDRIVVTDSVPTFRLPPEVAARRVDVVSAAGFFAEAIRRLHDGGSLVDLNDSFRLRPLPAESSVHAVRQG